MSRSGAVSLRSLQRSFARALFAPERTIAAALRRRIAGRSAFGVDARMGVYSHAYAARLVEVLAGDYGALRAMLEEDVFAWYARRYVAAHPSRHPNLNRFGANLPAFLRREGAPRLAVGLARFELALTRAFDAPYREPMEPEALAALPASCWSEARLVANPSVRILRLPAAAVDFHGAWRLGEVRRGPASWRTGDVYVVVFRTDDRLGRRELPKPAADLLRAVVRGRSLAAAVEHVPPGSPVDEWFAQWRTDGLFVGVRGATVRPAGRGSPRPRAGRRL